MGILSVLIAAAAGWVFGAVWYGIVGKKWMIVAGLTEETINRKNYVAFVGSFICAILVAGMMRHIFAGSGVDTLRDGFVSGLGLGVFIATPWIATNYLFAQRPAALTLYDGVYASGASAVMGTMLVLI